MMINIFITDLSAYNHGSLVGRWINLPLSSFELSQALSEVLNEGESICGSDNHEEENTMRRNLDLEHWTEDEEYEYLGLPPKPQWFKNLEKAWESNRKASEEKKAAIAKEKEDELYKHIGKPPNDADAYIEWCNMMADHLKPRPVDRPKLSPEQRKKPKIKRSEQMRQLLKDNGIAVLEDSTLEGYSNLMFLPNGRVGGKRLNISVYQFLQNLNDK